MQLRVFLEKNYSRVVSAVTMLGVSYPEAEDAVQDALVRAWGEAADGSIERLDAWITVVAWNGVRSRLRRVRAERRAVTRMAASGRFDVATDVDGSLDIARALKRLPRRTAEVAILRYLLQLSTRETAVALGIAEETVKRSLAEARVALARALAIDEQEEVSDDPGR